MRKIIGLAAAWVAATLVAVVIAAAAVSSVRSEVTDTPTALGAPTIATSTTTQAPASGEPPTSTTIAQPDTTTSTTLPVVDTSTSTTTPPRSTTTTTVPLPVTTTTTAPATTTTTTTTSSSYTKTYGTEVGLPGSVTIVVSGASVMFAGATALPGWTVGDEKRGPEEVEVEFERNDNEDEAIEFKAEVEDGNLKVEISFPDDH